MICPKCKYEYREGYTKCPECICDLINKPEKPVPRPNEREKFLTQAVDEYEAEIILALLKSNGIFGFKQYKGSDGYNKIFLGRTILGVNIYVGESDYSTAKELLESALTEEI